MEKYKKAVIKNKNEIAISAILLLIAVPTGYFIGHQVLFTQTSFEINEEINNSNQVVTVDFEGQKVDFILEDHGEADFYADYGQNRDNFQTIKIQSNDTVRNGDKIMDFQGFSYRVNFQYKDNPNESNDAWVLLQNAEKLR